MNKFDLKKALLQLPKDLVMHSVRDVCFLTSVIFVKIHFIEIKHIYGVGFSAIFTYPAKGQTEFYRSPLEYAKFAKRVGESYFQNSNFARKASQKLIALTDWFENFEKKHPNLRSFILDKNIFFRNFKTFFAHHQAVGFGGEYLALKKVRPSRKKRLESIVKLLGEAYAYNEMAVPKLEVYFKKLKINCLAPEEIAIPLPKFKNNRCFLGTADRLQILSKRKIDELKNKMDARSNKITQKNNPIKGLGIGKGKYVGPVFRVLSLSDLPKIKTGQVLVSAITRPQYNHVLKKAGAIVTDLGGLLSHPAILAREFGIPCIVGTNNATKVFKDGDMVEVNASKGIIKKI